MCGPSCLAAGSEKCRRTVPRITRADGRVAPNPTRGRGTAREVKGRARTAGWAGALGLGAAISNRGRTLIGRGPGGWARIGSRGDGANHRHRRQIMPKIKHIAMSTQDVDKTAKFYVDVFGMKEIARIDSPGARGYYLSDGDINLAILNFKNDDVAGVERGKEWSGIHHIGFQVEDLDAIAERLAAAGSAPRDDVNHALNVAHVHEHRANVEVKYNGPDGVMVDVSETGWVGTTGFNA